MPKTPHTATNWQESLRRVWMLQAAPVTAAALTATALAGAPVAQAAEAADVAAASRAADVSAYAAAALIVGGTTFPSVERSFMESLWPLWSNSLGLPDTSATALISVPYPAELSPFTTGDDLGTSVSAGVDSLLNLLTTTYTAGGHLILWGISQGALVLNAAQRVLAADPSAPPAGSLTFVRVADPSAEITGMLNFLPGLVMSKVLNCEDVMRTAATESQYNSIVVTNEYDAFADFPDKPWNLLAIANAIAGLWYRHGQTGTADLTTVPVQNITTTVNSLGAMTTSYLVPAPFLPLTQVLRDAGANGAIVDALESALRPIVDAGYTRNDPQPAEVQPVVDPGRTAPRVAATRPQTPATAARTTNSEAAAPASAATSAATKATATTTKAPAASRAPSSTRPSSTRPSNRTR